MPWLPRFPVAHQHDLIDAELQLRGAGEPFRRRGIQCGKACGREPQHGKSAEKNDG